MKYFKVIENISSNLYMQHTCFKHTSMCEKYKPMK